MLTLVANHLVPKASDLLYSVGGLLTCSFILLFGADLLYYILTSLRILPWDPKNDPFRHVPFERRLETLSMAFVSATLFISMLFCFWSCLNLRYTWWWLLPYLGYCVFNQAHNRGGRPSLWLRGSSLMRYLVQYFSTNLVKWHPDTPFPPDSPYLFGYHPHGILGCGVVAGFVAPDIHKLFPGLNLIPCTLNIVFITPLLKDWVLAMGFASVGYNSLDYILKQGNGSGAVVVVGGAKESQYTRRNTHDLILSKRKGFFRLALKHGCRIVPVYGFGENNVFEMSEPSPWRRWISSITESYIGFSLPAFNGRGIFQKGFGIYPRRYPLNVVFGDPIKCPKIKHPTDEEVEKIQSQYRDALVKMFEEVKVKYVENPRKEKLQFVY